MAVRREDGEGAVRAAEAVEAGEEGAPRTGDLEARVREERLLPGAAARVRVLRGDDGGGERHGGREE